MSPLPVTVANEGLKGSPTYKYNNPGVDWHPGRGDNPTYNPYINGLINGNCCFFHPYKFKGQWDVPLTAYPWYLLCSLGILGDNLPINTHNKRPYIGISHRGTLVGVHPTIPWQMELFHRAHWFSWHPRGFPIGFHHIVGLVRSAAFGGLPKRCTPPKSKILRLLMAEIR